jgi:molecular chaperone GrpE
MSEEQLPEIMPEPVPEATPQDKLQESQKKAAEYYDQLLRLTAEFDNFRKRTEREKTDARQGGKQDVITPMLSLVDVFEQALQQAQHAKDVNALVQGLGFLHKSFSEFLKAEGLQPLDLTGKTFDPHLAEAVEQIEVDGDNVGKVLSELQRGYTFQGKILRPGRVRVGVAKKETNGETQ